MLIPVEWIKDFVETPEDPAELADRLTLTGNEIEEIRESESGPVYYLKLTPNRADMLAIEGIGREVAALYERPFRPVEVSLDAAGPAEPDVRVDVEAPDLCPRYAARVIRGVKIGPAPEWMKTRLEAAGVRSISNVVDVTNYVMLELGQPLHAFDLDKLAGGRIVVRRSRAGETIIPITAKDDAPPTALQPDMLVIADAERPVAIAGVMGGKETEVSGDTVNLLLESAYFDPTSVRRTAKRTDIRTDSSYRFERGVDPNGVRRASDRAVQLILELAGGTASETVIDVYPSPIEPKRIPFRPERCRGLLGVEIPDAETRGYLDRLGFGVEESEGQWHVTAPTYRPDLAIEEDIIEEVGRLYGYDRLPETLPGGVSGAGKHSPLEELIRSVRELLSGQGLYEVVTNTLLARTYLQATRLESSPVWPGPDGRAVSLRNPLSEEFDTLRPSLLPGLLTAAQHNLRHGTRDIYLYESGYGTTETGDGQPTHRLLTAGLLLGSRWSEVWNPDRQGAVDFFGAKGTVEALVRGLGVPSLAGERAEHPAFHPGRAAWLSAGAERIGIVGELHPELAASLDLPRGVFLFELDAERLLVLSRSGERRYEAPSRYPRALRDLAITVDQTVPSGGIEQVIRETVGEFARSVRLFDVYAGKPLPEGKVSLAYALELGADDRTLTDEEVEGRLTAARERLQSEYGAEFRG